MMAPIGSIESFTPGGGATAAQASAEFGVPQMLCSVCNPGLEAVAKAADNFRIFQLYVRGDDAFVDDHVSAPVANGYTGFCLTVDTAVVQPARARPGPALRQAVARAGDRLRLPGRASAGTRSSGSRTPAASVPLILKGIATGRGRGARRASTGWTSSTSPTTAGASSTTGAARSTCCPRS